MDGRLTRRESRGAWTHGARRRTSCVCSAHGRSCQAAELLPGTSYSITDKVFAGEVCEIGTLCCADYNGQIGCASWRLANQAHGARDPKIHDIASIAYIPSLETGKSCWQKADVRKTKFEAGKLVECWLQSLDCEELVE